MSKSSPFCIGLTGNIGSGKSTVATYFKALGVDIISADEVAKKLTQITGSAYGKIKHHFGDKCINQISLEINRAYLREVISRNPNEKKWLEDLLHPMIRKQIESDVLNSKASYVIIEIPLLYDKKLYPYLNRVLTVISDPNLQIQRVSLRDNCSERSVEALLKTQPSLEQRQNLTDDIIINNADLDALKQQVKNLHLDYMNRAKLI